MAVEEHLEDIAVERVHERATREFSAELERRRQEHEYRLAETRLVHQLEAKAKLKRVEIVERVLMGVLKLLPVLLLSLSVPLLVLAKREVPQFLQDFMSL